MNWKRIIVFAALLFVSGVLVGFIKGGYTGTDVTVLRQQLVLSVCLSLGLSVAIFTAMSLRQDYRPYLHALLAVALLKAFSLALVASFPAMLGGTPVVLVVLDWITLGVALVTGTALGRYMAGQRRKARADA